jgi:hypothetical protein
MNTNAPMSPAEENVWDVTPEETQQAEPKPAVKSTKSRSVEKPQAPKSVSNADYDLEGLMTDFPTAKELERFVFDETGVVLNLKGRANKLKYQVAMDVLNGVEVDAKFIGGDNPYVEKSELVPEEPLRPAPARDTKLPPHTQIQNTFWSPMIPHPDPDARSQDKKCHVMFRKYNNGMVSYEIQGPLELYPVGEKIDKYGRTRPEIMKWLDPRTGEQIAVRADGTLTPQGKRLRAMMQSSKFRVNKGTQWDSFIDREFISINDSVADNPWELK